MSSDGRWVIVDLEGKENRVRTVPMPNWAKAAIDRWTAAAGISRAGHTHAAGEQGRRTRRRSVTAQSVFEIVERYSNRLGVPRRAARSAAYVCEARASRPCPAGADSAIARACVVQTTERYLGLEQDLVDAPCDHLGLRL